MSKLINESSIPEIISEMSTEEKLKMLTGGCFFSTCKMEKYGIPALRTIDGAPGINYMQAMLQEAGEAYFAEHPDEPCTMQMMGAVPGCAIASKLTYDEEIKLEEYADEDRKFYQEFYERHPQDPSSFPAGMMLGATWNPEVVYKVGEALGKEYQAFAYDVALGPNVNIHRDPLNGRLFEGYSEDPVLICKLAPEFIKGLQSTGTLACVKHYAANNQETARNNGEEHISKQALYDIYFPGFKACVQEGKSASVMSAYNKINGVACAHNAWLLKDVLRTEWGYDGAVISDWGAVYDKVEGIRGGNDLEMPSNTVIQAAKDALENGDLAIEDVNQAVANVLRLVLRSNAFKGAHTDSFNDEESREAAYQAAAEGSVLLKNDGILPLKQSAKIAFSGERCKKFNDSGAGSAKVVTKKTSSLPKTLEEYLGADHVHFGKPQAGDTACVVAVAANGQEGSDRRKMDLEDDDKEVLLETIKTAKACGVPVIVVMNIAGPVDVSEWINDVAAVLCVFIPGREGGHVAGDILSGKINPSGKLPLTFPRHYRDCPSAMNFPGYNDEVWYGEGIYVGYRYYDFKKIKPQYAFGYGMSYTQFEISNYQLISDMDQEADIPLKFAITVTNVGETEGKEVVQVYIAQKKRRIAKAEKELKAFRKIGLKAGESKDIEFVIYPQELASYDIKRESYITDRGKYAVLIGNSSDHISINEEFELKAKDMGTVDEDTAIELIGKSDESLSGLLTAVRAIGYQLEAKDFYAAVKKEADMSLTDYLNSILDISLFASSEDARRKSIAYIINEVKGLKL